MAAKPNIPVSRKEMYLDVATGGSTELPSPVTREEKYLAKIAGESVGIPTPVTRYEMLLAAVAGESYTLTPVTRLEVYLAKAAGQDVEVPQPITREEMYWFDYVSGQPTPSEREYTGAVPVTFTADGTPLLDYLISGKTVQTGTPTPDSPIMPQGTGERTGNLVNLGSWSNQYSTDTRTFFSARFRVSGGNYKQIDVKSTGTYKLTLGNLTNETVEFLHNGSARNILIFSYTANFAEPTNLTVSFTASGYDPTTINGINLSDIMLNTGSTALPYEPYGYKIPISSANTTTPVYLGEVQSTRKIKKLVLTGEEGWAVTSNGVFRIGLSGQLRPFTPLCTHYLGSDASAWSNVPDKSVTVSISGYLAILDTTYTTTTDFKAYLAQQYSAGTPVTIWYVLATPTTGIVNEPIRKIGDYADTLSMEQAGVQIPTVKGENALDVLTTVKPSEVYIKYKGYPVAGSQTSLQSSAYAPAEVSSQSESIDDINSSLLGKDEET